MTDLILTSFQDATIRQARPDLNDGASEWVRVKAASASDAMRGLVFPELPDILGRDVLSATIIGRLGPGSSAATMTLTPYLTQKGAGRITWTNEPAVNTALAKTATVAAGAADGTQVSWDAQAMLQAVADGDEWYGAQLKSSSTAANQKFYASESGVPAWELHITLSDIPDPPSDQRPTGGGAVKDREPILAWFRDDLGGDAGDQTEARIQVDIPAAGVDPDEAAPDFDSGWHARTNPEYDLAAATYTPPGSPPGPTYWRVATDRLPDGSPLWSDWASFTSAPLPTLVIDSPTGAFGDPSPIVAAHLVGGTVSTWRAQATGPSKAEIRDDTGPESGAISWEVPFKNKDGRRIFTSGQRQYVYLKVEDTVDRAQAVGQKAFVDAWINIDLVESPALTPVTNLTVTQLVPGVDPRNVWSWQRTVAAGRAWIIEVDDEEVERLDPADVSVNAGVYSWQDYGHISPLRPHKLRVRAVDDASGQKSQGAYLDNRSHDISGVWLLPLDPTLGGPIKMSGTVVGGWTREDRAATFVPQEGPEVDIIYDTPQRTGSFEGTIDYQQDVWGAIATINKLRADKRRMARLIWGSQSLAVRLRSPDATSHEEINKVNLLHATRFGFVGLS